MKEVHVIFISTCFKTGEAIRMLTRGDYSHVAISLKPGESEWYSFCRSRYHEPLLGGFNREYTDRYARNPKPTYVKVNRVWVDDEQYERMESMLEHYKENRDKTRYNFFNLILYPLRLNVRMPFTHTCLSFAAELLDCGHVRSIQKLEEIVGDDVLFEGNLAKHDEKVSVAPYDFYERRSRRSVYIKSGKAMLGLATLLLLRRV